MSALLDFDCLCYSPSLFCPCFYLLGCDYITLCHSRLGVYYLFLDFEYYNTFTLLNIMEFLMLDYEHFVDSHYFQPRESRAEGSGLIIKYLSIAQTFKHVFLRGFCWF